MTYLYSLLNTNIGSILFYKISNDKKIDKRKDFRLNFKAQSILIYY